MEAKANKAAANVTVMKPVDLLGLVLKEKPGMLGKMPEKKAATIISAALAQLGKRIETVKEGAVRVPGLGGFRVKQVEQVREGKKATVRRVIFNAAKPKAK
jgi:hypothetical protein